MPRFCLRCAMEYLTAPLGLLAGMALGLLLTSWIPLAESQGGPNVVQTQPHRVVSIADVTVTNTATLIDGADENRLFLNITNTDASNTVRWGEQANISSSRGQQIRPLATVTITGTYAVYMIRDTANSVVVSATKELRS